MASGGPVVRAKDGSISTPFDVPGARITFPRGINDAGQVVGTTACFPGPGQDCSRAFPYTMTGKILAENRLDQPAAEANPGIRLAVGGGRVSGLDEVGVPATALRQTIPSSRVGLGWSLAGLCGGRYIPIRGVDPPWV
jgi:hypothetical protein